MSYNLATSGMRVGTNILYSGLPAPVNDNDAARKTDLFAVAAGLSYKESVRVATAGALPAYTRTANVITANANGALGSIDGINLSLNNRLLVKNGAVGQDNGIYVVTALGDGGTPYVLTRSSDMDNSSELSGGTTMWVNEGTVNADSAYTLITDGAITLNTTPLTFTNTSGLGQIIAGNGLTKTGNTISVALDGTTLAASGSGTKVNPNGITSTELANGSVIGGKIANGGISANTQFGVGVVDSTALAAGAVTGGKIANGGVSSNTQLGTGVVDNAALANGAVTLAKLFRPGMGNFIIGQGAGADAQTFSLSGDATTDGTGVVTVANGAITAAKLNTSFYATGTYTPTVTLVGGAGNTVPQYTTNTGRYVQIGNRVFVDVLLDGDGGNEGAGTGQYTVSLPITSSANNPAGHSSIGLLLNNATYFPMFGAVGASATTVGANKISAGVLSALVGADQNNVTRTVRLNFSYEV